MAEQFRPPNAQFSSELYCFHICIMLTNSSFNSFASYAVSACVRPYCLHNYFMLQFRQFAARILKRNTS